MADSGSAKSGISQELKSLSEKRGSNKPVSLILHNLPLAAVVSKLNRPREESTFKTSNPESTVGMVNTGIDQISKSIMNRIGDNENIFKLFPDIELAAQIVISSILSPKDMVEYELIYRTKNNNFPPQITSKLIAIIKETINVEYGLQNELPDILRKALFETGSYIKAIIPEAAVDQIINRGSRITTESIANTDLFSVNDFDRIRHQGLLGDPNAAMVQPKENSSTRLFTLEAALNASGSPTYNSKLYIRPKGEGEPVDVNGIVVEKFKELVAGKVDIDDNYQFLKFPKVLERINAQKVADITSSGLRKTANKFATETAEKITKGQLQGMLYKSASAKFTPFLAIPTPHNLKRKSVGRPLPLLIPSESAIPVYVPGDPSKHIGLFVIADVDGNPITVASSTSNGSDQGMAGMMGPGKANASFSSLLTDKARQNLSSDAIVPMVDSMTELYADIIESDLMERIAKGSYGKSVQIARSNEIYQVMLARALKSQYTRLIYIPIEYVTYYAFDYHRNGVGKSYLDDMANITSFRAMVMFSKVMAKIKSSVTTTSVNVALDPRDHDPLKTIEMAKYYVARSRQQYFPHGLSHISDLTDWIHRAGIQIAFSGHPDLPETKFEFESKNIQHSEPDDTLDETFRHQMYMHFGLSPDTVDNAAKADFATTIQQNSILFARRIFMWSNLFSALLTDNGKKIAQNDQVLTDECYAVLKENIKELLEKADDEEKKLYEEDPEGYLAYVLFQFLDILEIDLPKPNTTRNESLKNEFASYEQMVDNGLKYIFSDSVIASEFAGKSNEYVKAVSDAWKSSLMRQWMADNNYLPELFKIAETTEEGKSKFNLLESVKIYTESIMLNIDTFVKALEASKAAVGADLTKVENGGSEPEGGEGAGEPPAGGEGGGGEEFPDQMPLDEMP